MSSEVVVKLDHKGNVVRAKPSFRVKVRLEKDRPTAYGGAEPPAPEVKKMGLPKRKLSFSMT